MCGRYQAWIDDEELIGIIEREKRGNGIKYFRQNDVFPGSEMPLIYGSYSTVRAHVSRWGFPTDFGGSDISKKTAPNLIINARAETAAYKPMFREAFENSRALVLASGYYEWSDGAKYRFYRNDGEPVLMAALERVFGDERRYVIVTTEAIGTPSVIHDRMPVFVDKSEMRDWLYDADFARQVLSRRVPCRLKSETA